MILRNFQEGGDFTWSGVWLWRISGVHLRMK